MIRMARSAAFSLGTLIILTLALYVLMPAPHADAAVYSIASSTRFNDGAQFGLGAEVAISTNKMHARGPMGLRELTSYKWIVMGTGQIRS